METNDLEPKVIDLLKKIDVEIPPTCIEAVHRVGRDKRNVIVKVSRRKDADKVRVNRPKLKDADLSSDGFLKDVYIFDSLCNTYKNLRFKCKLLKNSRKISKFWVYLGHVFMKISEDDNPILVDHDQVLRDRFPEIDDLLK